MSTKFVLLATAILAVVLTLRLSNLKTLPDSNSFEVQGQITSSPYLALDQIVFYLGRYKVSANYQNLNYGDNVKVLGSKKGFEVRAAKVSLLQKNTIEQTLFDLRKKLNQAIVQHFPEPQSQLLSGVLLGIKSNLSREFKSDLISTGTIHVVVVSGYNIILLASFILLLAPFLGRRKTTFLALMGIVAYTFLVGLSAPTLRALIMGSIALSAVLLGRRALPLYALALSATAMLILNPEYLFDISFQLSLAATLSVLIFTKILEVKLIRIPKFFRDSLATSLAAQILVLPLIFYHFGQVSLMSPLVNTLVLWTVPLSTIMGFIFLLAALISSLLANIISYILIFPLTVFTFAVQFFGKFNFLVLNLDKGNLISMFGYYLVVCALSLKYLVLSSKINKKEKGND